MKIPSRTFAFSLVELLVVLGVIAIMLYFAFPNVVQVKSDSERDMAKARAETLNLAAAAYFQNLGPTAALSNWTAAATSEARYDLLKPYIAFPAPSLGSFLPSSDYSVSFDASEPHKRKATLIGPTMGATITNIPY